MRSEIHSLPEEFLDKLKHIVPSRKWDEIANTFSENCPTTFRANSLKVNPRVIREKLESKGFRLETVSWYPDAFILKQERLRELQETEVYRTGEIYVQSLSSMIPPLVLDPQPGERILDMTAAPGSKTTQLACLMGGKGRIVANDNNRVRFFRLKANVELQGARNVELLCQYGESLGRKYPEQFDRVLLDAPCSAEGRFNVQAPSSYKYWKPAKVREMARKQKKLLFSAIQSLRPGGVLVYSTCTFSPEENEGILSQALEKFNDTIELETIKLSFPNRMAGLSSWEGENFPASIKKTIRILPTSQMEGFFVARMLKKKMLSR